MIYSLKIKCIHLSAWLSKITVSSYSNLPLCFYYTAGKCPIVLFVLTALHEEAEQQGHPLY